ncbi:MAG: hypothetical protein ACTSRR_09665 [Candidatus Heimdallarchaeaceae archaeon]
MVKKIVVEEQVKAHKQRYGKNKQWKRKNPYTRKKTRYKQSERDLKQQYAQRSKRARALDERKTAKKVYEPPVISSSSFFDFRRADVKNIDTAKKQKTDKKVKEKKKEGKTETTTKGEEKSLKVIKSKEELELLMKKKAKTYNTQKLLDFLKQDANPDDEKYIKNLDYYEKYREELSILIASKIKQRTKEEYIKLVDDIVATELELLKQVNEYRKIRKENPERRNEVKEKVRPIVAKKKILDDIAYTFLDLVNYEYGKKVEMSSTKSKEFLQNELDAKIVEAKKQYTVLVHPKDFKFLSDDKLIKEYTYDVLHYATINLTHTYEDIAQEYKKRKEKFKVEKHEQELQNKFKGKTLSVSKVDQYLVKNGNNYKPTQTFWQLWRKNKKEIKEKGYKVRKQNGEWIVEKTKT